MGLPPANTVLFFLCAFLTLWGLSVIVRARRFATIPGTRRCPECRRDMRGVPGRRCPSCGYEPKRETDLFDRAPDTKRTVVGALSSLGGLLLLPVAISVYRWEQSDWLGIGPINAAFWGVAAFGLTVAIWAWRGDRARGRRRCPKCWYDMSATLASAETPDPDAARPADTRCPECGHEPPNTRALYRPRRRPRAALLGLGLIALGLYGQTVPRALRTGPLGLVPTTVMVVGIRWLPANWYTGRESGNLESRARDGELWRWQRRLGHGLAAGSLGSRWSCERAACVAMWLNPRDDEDCRKVTEGTLSVLCDERFDPTPATARAMAGSFEVLISRSLSGKTWSEARTPPPEATAALPMLIRRVESGDPAEAELALLYLYLYRLHSEDLIPALAERAQTRSRSQRLAVSVLARHFDQSESARSVLAALLKNDDPRIRQIALQGAFEALPGQKRTQACDLMIDVALNDQDPATATRAAELIWSSGMYNEPAKKLAATPDLPESARIALLNMFELGVVEQALPVVLPLLESPDPQVVGVCLRRLNRFVTDMPNARFLVMRRAAPCLTSNDPGVQRAARALIIHIGRLWPDCDAQAHELVPDMDERQAPDEDWGRWRGQG